MLSLNRNAGRSVSHGSELAEGGRGGKVRTGGRHSFLK